MRIVRQLLVGTHLVEPAPCLVLLPLLDRAEALYGVVPQSCSQFS